ncbi:MAG TPA: hypothetical protein VEU29_04630, partial [Actinomycetota bacterium]|nr:hypothetical protein [Actinomycetota bacterium]
DIPAGAALTKSLASRGLAREGETLQWQWANLVQNTLLFRIYLEVLPKAESIEVFHGFFPAQAIAAALRIDDALTF